MKLINRIAIIFSIAATLPNVAQCQSNWWVTGGFSLNRLVVQDKLRSYEDTYSFKSGFQLGVSKLFVIDSTFRFESGIQLAVRGSYLLYEDHILGYKINVSGHSNVVYLEIPFIARISLTKSSRGGMYLCGGAYVGAALFGNIRGGYYFRREFEKVSESLSFGNDESIDDLRGFDAGFIAGLGAIWPELDIRFTYNHGVANVSVERDNGLRANTNSLNLTIALNIDDLFKK